MKDRDKFLTEAMGICWHDWVPIKAKHGAFASNLWECRCGVRASKLHLTDPLPNNPDFSKWTGFGKLWEWAIEQEWWGGFRDMKIGETESYESGKITKYIKEEYINPDNFANAIYEYLKDDK